MPDKKILVIGDVMLDIYHFGEVNRISPEAPVPVFLETGRTRYVPGGAANVAVNIAVIGVPVDLCSVTGNDREAEQLISLLAEQRVGTDMVHKQEGRQTTSKLRFIGPNHQQILRADTEDIEEIPYQRIEDLVKKVCVNIEQYGLFLLSDYKKGFLTEKTTQAFIAMANSHHIPVLVDVKDQNFQKYRNATLLKPNKKELSDLTGMSTATGEETVAAAEYLCRMASCQYVLTTLGAEGMLLIERGKLVKRVNSVAREVYDVTGAGDTSIAYLAASLMQGKDILEAMEISNYAAGLQVSKMGTSIVRPEEVACARNRNDRDGRNKKLNFYQDHGLEPLKERQQLGEKVVFTNGCFDILHAGHISYLKEAKKLGDILVVGVNDDESVKRLKGESRPVNPVEDRLMLLSALECVDYVIPFQEDTPLELIRKIKPDMLVKGGDYQMDQVVGAREVLQNGGEVRLLPFIRGRSTTEIIEKIGRL